MVRINFLHGKFASKPIVYMVRFILLPCKVLTLKKPTEPKPAPFVMIPKPDILDVEPLSPTKALPAKPNPKTNAQYQADYRARMKADRTGSRLNTDLALKSLDNLAYIAEHHKITKRAMLERLIDAEAEKVAVCNIATQPQKDMHSADVAMIKNAQQRQRDETDRQAVIGSIAMFKKLK
jgi:hypothetical protein